MTLGPELLRPNVRGLKTLMIFLFPLTSVVILSVAIAALQMAA